MTSPSHAATGDLPVAGAAEARHAAVRLTGGERGIVAWMLALSILATAAGLAGPFLLGRIIDTVRQGTSVGRIDRLAALIVVFAVVQLVFTRYARLVAARFGERTAARVREQFLDRALALPARVVERTPLGDLAARATTDVTTVSATLRDAGPAVLIAVVQTLLILVAVFIAGPLLGVCAIAGLAGSLFATRWYLRRARDAYLALGAANSALADVLTSTAAGARTVEALSLQEHRVQEGLRAIERAHATRLRTLRLRTVLYPIIDISAVVPIVGVLLVGGALYLHGAIALGSVAAAALYLRQLSGPIETFSIWIDQLQSCGASIARLEGIADAPTTRTGRTRRPASERIDITGVSYSYDGRRDVLIDIDLAIRPGERLAVVGASGAGKSTLARLIAGVDAPRAGSLTVGGVPTAELPPHQLRRHVVLITQDNHVFRGSIKDNLLIARTDATDEDVRSVLADIGATWLANLPDGLDTDLGAQPHRLDAGQAQQLALARVILADPHTVVLDEATAMLDPTSARRTEQALSAVLAGRTVLTIAHRLHTAHDADRIAVMEGGRLSETGTHHDLLARHGTYAALWDTWHGDQPNAATTLPTARHTNPEGSVSTEQASGS